MRVPGWLAVPVMAALCARLLLVIGQIEFGLFDFAYDAADSVLYRGIAEELHENGRYWFNGQPTAFVEPGYPLFLAALYAISRSTLFIALVQSVLGAATVGFIADTARRLTGRIPAALTAGSIAALYPHFLFWTGFVLTETLYLFALAVAIWATEVLLDRRSTFWAMGAGVAWGATVLVRPITLGFVLVVATVGLGVTRWRRMAAFALIAFVAVWGLWIARNAMTFDAFIPTSTETGSVLWQGNSPGATGGTRGYVDAHDFDALPEAEDLGEVEQERVYRGEALAWMRSHPDRVLALAPRKLANMFRPTYAGASLFNTIVTLATYPVLLLLGASGLIAAWRKRSLVHRFLVILVAYHLLIHALVTGMIRFRLPVEMMLCIAAGMSVAAFLDRKHSVPE